MLLMVSPTAYLQGKFTKLHNADWFGRLLYKAVFAALFNPMHLIVQDVQKLGVAI